MGSEGMGRDRIGAGEVVSYRFGAIDRSGQVFRDGTKIGGKQPQDLHQICIESMEQPPLFPPISIPR